MTFELIHSRYAIDKNKNVSVNFYKDTGSIENLDDTDLRRAHCFFFVYNGFEIGSGMYFVSFTSYKYKSADDKYHMGDCPKNIILPISLMSTSFVKSQQSDISRLGQNHFIAGYHVDKYVSDLKDAFAFYCQSQLDLVRERTGMEWNACIDFSDCRREMALSKLIEMERSKKKF